MFNISDTYERELRDEILIPNGIYTIRSAGSLNVDLVALRGSNGCIIEEKSSKDKTIYLSGNRLKTQYKGYMSMSNNYDVDVFYFFRWKSGKHWDKQSNWKVFHIDDIEMSDKNNPILRWEYGTDVEEWIRTFK